jgi:hypothetical protein
MKSVGSVKYTLLLFAFFADTCMEQKGNEFYGAIIKSDKLA